MAALFLYTPNKQVSIALLLVTSIYVTQLIVPAIRNCARFLPPNSSNVVFLLPLFLFFVPYFLYAYCVSLVSAWSNEGALVAISFAVVVYAWSWRDLFAAFQPINLKKLPSIPLVTVVMRSYQSIVSAIAQEVFYRGVLFALLEHTMTWMVIPFSATLFTLEHYANRWGREVYTWTDYIRFFVLSLGFGVVAFVYHSVLAAIIGHLFYNLIGSVQLWVRYYFSGSPQLQENAS